MKLLLILLTILAPLPTYAEYRVYQYLVKSTNTQAMVNVAQARPILSTLNPVAFRAYHGGSLVDLTLMRSWMCVGYTGQGEDVCPAPSERLEATSSL